MSQIVVDDIVRIDGAKIGTTILPQILVGGSGLQAAEFFNLPQDIKEIKVMMRAVSSSTSNNMRVQLGSPAGWITTGYSSASINSTGTGLPLPIITNSFVIYIDSSDDTLRGQMIISKFDDTTWVQSGGFMRSSTAASDTFGDLNNAPAVIDRIRVTCTGAGIFDTGRIVISYTI